MKKSIMMALILGLTMAVAPLSFAGLATFQNGGDRLVDTQYTDGGWGWYLNAPPTYGNILGPIAMGLAQAYNQTADAGQLAALADAGAFLLAKTNDFSPSDGYLATELDSIFGGTTYADHVMANFYNALAAGSYNRNGDGILYTTETYIQLIRDARAGGGIGNLATWDIGMGLYAAGQVGADTSAWIAGVGAELDELDGAGYFDVIGLAGGILGLASVGEDYNTTAGEHVAAGNLSDLANILASYQIDGGGFAWNSGYVIANDDNESIQETAYSLLALNEFDASSFIGELAGAGNYLTSTQLGTGGWEGYAGSGENNEITGEALWALNSAPVVPVPTTAGLVLMGFGCLAARRRKRRS
ncbi:MAG: PEP-CTERM sorting domain-containing protein [Candidatus Hydrogenedentes bacterium]|nr:PEP-CTERM sorting domain-containing protein [Candidatus Hydrogenedentota bacterium]